MANICWRDGQKKETGSINAESLLRCVGMTYFSNVDVNTLNVEVGKTLEKKVPARSAFGFGMLYQV